MIKEQIFKSLQEQGIDVSAEQKEKLDKYFHLLVDNNKLFNLTAITAEDDVYEKHFYDSLIIKKYIDFNDKKVLDVGSGAGFPGIIIALFTNARVTMIDSNAKKIKFINKIIDELNIKNADAFCARCEEYAMQRNNQFDIIVSRAVAHLSILLEISVRAAKIGGLIVALKGPNFEEEFSSRAFSLLGLSKPEVSLLTLPSGAQRAIVTCKKISDNTKYPRLYQQIVKEKL